MSTKNKKYSTEFQVKHVSRFTEIYFVVRRFCLRKQYDPELIAVISTVVYNTFYGEKSGSSVPRNTRWLRQKKIGAILDIFNDYRMAMEQEPYSTKDTDSVIDHFRDIHHESMIELTVLYPDLVIKLQDTKGRKLSKPIRLLLHLYVKKIYSIEQQCRILKVNKKALVHLQKILFEKILKVYDRFYGAQSAIKK